MNHYENDESSSPQTPNSGGERKFWFPQSWGARGAIHTPIQQRQKNYLAFWELLSFFPRDTKFAVFFIPELAIAPTNEG
jgi:hypothetical protein